MTIYVRQQSNICVRDSKLLCVEFTQCDGSEPSLCRHHFLCGHLASPMWEKVPSWMIASMPRCFVKLWRS
jgi:hypothetical protein